MRLETPKRLLHYDFDANCKPSLWGSQCDIVATGGYQALTSAKHCGNQQRAFSLTLVTIETSACLYDISELNCNWNLKPLWGCDSHYQIVYKPSQALDSHR